MTLDPGGEFAKKARLSDLSCPPPPEEGTLDLEGLSPTVKGMLLQAYEKDLNGDSLSPSINSLDEQFKEFKGPKQRNNRKPKTSPSQLSSGQSDEKLVSKITVAGLRNCLNSNANPLIILPGISNSVLLLSAQESVMQLTNSVIKHLSRADVSKLSFDKLEKGVSNLVRVLQKWPVPDVLDYQQRESHLALAVRLRDVFLAKAEEANYTVDSRLKQAIYKNPLGRYQIPGPQYSCYDLFSLVLHADNKETVSLHDNLSMTVLSKLVDLIGDWTEVGGAEQKETRAKRLVGVQALRDLSKVLASWNPEKGSILEAVKVVDNILFDKSVFKKCGSVQLAKGLINQVGRIIEAEQKLGKLPLGPGSRAVEYAYQATPVIVRNRSYLAERVSKIRNPRSKERVGESIGKWFSRFATEVGEYFSKWKRTLLGERSERDSLSSIQDLRKIILTDLHLALEHSKSSEVGEGLGINSVVKLVKSWADTFDSFSRAVDATGSSGLPFDGENYPALRDFFRRAHSRTGHLLNSTGTSKRSLKRDIPPELIEAARLEYEGAIDKSGGWFSVILPRLAEVVLLSSDSKKRGVNSRRELAICYQVTKFCDGEIRVRKLRASELQKTDRDRTYAGLTVAEKKKVESSVLYFVNEDLGKKPTREEILNASLVFFGRQKTPVSIAKKAVDKHRLTSSTISKLTPEHLESNSIRDTFAISLVVDEGHPHDVFDRLAGSTYRLSLGKGYWAKLFFVPNQKCDVDKKGSSMVVWTQIGKGQSGDCKSVATLQIDWQVKWHEFAQNEIRPDYFRAHAIYRKELDERFLEQLNTSPALVEYYLLCQVVLGRYDTLKEAVMGEWELLVKIKRLPPEIEGIMQALGGDLPVHPPCLKRPEPKGIQGIL